MAEAPSRIRHPKAKSSTDSSVIKLKAAFQTPKKKLVSSRASSISNKSSISSRPQRKDRSVRFTYHSGISEILDISKNLDKVSVLVDHLHMRVTPVTSLSPPPRARPADPPHQTPRKKPVVQPKKSDLNSTISSITDMESLYHKRSDCNIAVPVIKETKPKIVRKMRELIRETLPLLRV